MSSHVFRAFWPILEPRRPVRQLLQEAYAELDEVAARAHATLIGRPRFSIAPSSSIPGTGNATREVLVVEAPAIPAPARPYWSRSA